MELNFLKNKKIWKKHSIQPDPKIYWMVIFCIGFVLIIISLAFGFYLFLKINKDEAIPSIEENMELKKISRQRIEQALLVFSERENTSLEILNSENAVVDPSL